MPTLQVRDALNLTYDVTMEISLFNRLKVGWWIIHVTSRPTSISDAVAASLRVLRNVASARIRDSELERAKRAVLTRMDSDSKVCRSPSPPHIAVPVVLAMWVAMGRHRLEG